MSFRRILGVILCAGAALIAAGAAQAQGIYLQTTPTVLGESTTPGYVDQIVIESASLGLNKFCGTGTLQVSELVLAKPVDRASVDLIAAVQAGTVYTNFVVRFTRDDPVAGVINEKTYTLTDAVLTSHNSSDGAGSSGAESFSVVFSELEVEYRYVDSKGGQVPESVTIIPASCP